MSDVENIVGGGGPDRITGNPFAPTNLLKGNGGNDTIYGGDGNDTIDRGSGHDLLFGQSADDELFGKDGRSDTLDGGPGVDIATRDNGPAIFDVFDNVESFLS